MSAGVGCWVSGGRRTRYAEDLAGHRWTFSQSIADVDPQEWGGMLLESANDTA
jgi:hypothetical protein